MKKELGEVYLKQSELVKYNSTMTTLKDRNQAKDHYNLANSGFDRNH
jgi:hypothetical protein